MRINQVVNLTNLTKKAIRYYEEKGLISPFVNKENGYKQYNEKDITRLKMISFLRNIGMSVAAIKEYLNEPNKRERILLDFSKTITDQIEELRYANKLITKMINDNITDYEKLNETLIFNQQKRHDFVLKRLLMLFPNPFGKYLVLHFGVFLNEPLDSVDKKKAFKEIVEFLDNIEEIKLPDLFLKQMSELEEEKLSECYQKSHESMQEIAKINYNNQQSITKLKSEMKKNVEIRNKINTDTDNGYNKLRQDIENSLKSSGYYDRFIENLKVISKSYREYSDNIIKLGKVLGMSYDEKGNVRMES